MLSELIFGLTMVKGC